MPSDNVVTVLSGVNSSFATGPDSLHPHLLKACSAARSLPFCLLFGKALDEEVLPNLWNTSIVAPLYKIDLRCDPLDYRPVCLTSVCCKVLERAIVSQVVDYQKFNGMLSVN